MTQDGVERIRTLDGWRAVSILAVMAGHMLPLGPKRWDLNDMSARFGMSVFFILSGFLIVGILWRDQHVGRFLVRRVARIVPLAWATILVLFLLTGATLADWLANLFFYANLPPFHLSQAEHFWSLSVEMQYYLGIALVVAAAGRRGLWLVPPAAIAVTMVRIWADVPASIVTLYRLDDILAGGCLALVHAREGGEAMKRLLARTPLWLAVPVAIAASHHQAGPVAFVRPYVTALMVGALLYRPESRLGPLMESRPMAYVARISYALYVFHPFTMRGWLGQGDLVVRYLKRLLGFVLAFAGAHLSTFHFERIFIRWSHRGAP